MSMEEKLLKEILLEQRKTTKVLTEILNFFYTIQDDENGLNKNYLENMERNEGITKY